MKDTYLGPDMLALARVVGLTLGHHWAGLDETEFPCYDCAEMSLDNLRKSADMALDPSYPDGILGPEVQTDSHGDVSLAVSTPGCRLLVYGDSLRDCVALVAGRWRGIVAWTGMGEVSEPGLQDFIREHIAEPLLNPLSICAAMRWTPYTSERESDRSRAMPRHLTLLDDFLAAVEAVEADYPDHSCDYAHALQSVCSNKFRARVNDALWKVRAARKAQPICRAVSSRNTPIAQCRLYIAKRMRDKLIEHFPPGGPSPRFNDPVPVLRRATITSTNESGLDERLYDVVRASIPWMITE